MQRRMLHLQQILEGQAQEQIDEAKETLEKAFEIKLLKLERQLQNEIQEMSTKVTQQFNQKNSGKLDECD